jgi:hypothetical protein
MQIFAPAWHNGHFVMMVVDCLQKVFYFFYSLPTAARRALAPTLVNTCFEISVFLLTQYYIPLILLFAACIIEKSFGADMQGELEAYGCPYMAPTIQG